MTDQAITAAILGAVLLVGMVGVIGMVKSDVTGAAREPLGRRLCICEVSQINNDGITVVESVQTLRVRSAGTLTDAGCQNRCDQHFGRLSKSSRGWSKSVLGYTPN